MRVNAIYKVKENTNIAKDVFFMRLEGPTDCIEQPGQFLNIKLSGLYLRRPISVCDWDEKGIDIIYKILGQGTAQMAQYAPGTELDILNGLGNGFSVEPAKGKKTVLIGGGVGVPPLYGLAKRLIKQGVTPQVVLGFRSKEDVFYKQELEALGCAVAIATEDGTQGEKGFVTGPLANIDYEYYYTCGPQAMLHAVFSAGKAKGATGQLSFEERMGCGFGACMGCSCKTLTGAKRVCVEGPVFPSEEVLFE